MKERLCEGHKQKNVYEIGIQASGGPLKSTSQSHQPQNPKQVCKS